jgi:hypothetical protein
VNRIRNLALLCMVLSTAALSVGLVTADRSIALAPLGLVIAIGLLGELRGWSGFPTLWLLGQVVLCASAGRSPVWAIAAISLALAYWDLSGFLRRLRHAPRVDELDVLTRRHLVVLGGALWMGAGAGVLTTALAIEAGFGASMAAGLAALAGIAAILRRPAPLDPPVAATASGQADRNS